MSTDQLVTTAATRLHPLAGAAARAALAGGRRPGAPRWVRWLPFGLLVPMLFIVGLVAGSPSSDPQCTRPAAIFDGDLARVLATIRTLESGGNYHAQAAGSTASGAYQFLDDTWAGYGGYSRAWLAPPSLQDAKAAEWVTVILDQHPGDVPSVPVTWYIGHLPPARSLEWDTVPMPSAGNTLTPREYQAKWMTVYNDRTTGAAVGAVGQPPAGAPACSGVIGAPSPAPTGVDQLVASQISWGGYSNGDIPLTAMRYGAHSGYLHPGASAAWEQLWSAASAAGFDLSGWGYRPASIEPAATVGRSNHGWGLAIDVTVVVAGGRYPSVDAAFASPEYAWLQANAPTYGWINPAWAKPVAFGGNGHGGHVGNQCCFYEPWHWEWAGFLDGQTRPATTPDLRPSPR